jgi:hypothetical protein
VLGRMVIRVGDSYVGSSIVHPPYIGLAEHGRQGGDPRVLIFSLDDAPYEVFSVVLL